MFSAISGLRSNQVMMDVIGNNIANVNTVGFKSGRVDFEDILSQTARGGSSPNANLGSINPAQVGLGVTVAGIDVLHTQGNLQSTGRQTDLAIQGDGFFVMANGTNTFYTRDGAFDIGLDGTLLNPATGLRVLGWQADNAGNVDPSKPLTNLTIPIGRQMPALMTGKVALTGNLDARTATNGTGTTTYSVYDSLGMSHTVTITFTKTATDNSWTWAASTDPTDASASTTSTGTVTFLNNGMFSASTGTLSLALTNGASTPLAITVDMTNVGQSSGTTSVAGTNDGFMSGVLQTVAIGSSGEITGVYSNGQTQRVGQLALTTFTNPGGLLRQGQNLFQVSSASGTPFVGLPNSGGRGTIATGNLEMSNVDLATQFTGMITAQRAFQANGRVITTSDEMLQDLVNLKR